MTTRSLLLLIALTGCPPPPPGTSTTTMALPQPGQPLPIEIRIDELTCATPTDDSIGNNRDEVYVAVVATDSNQVTGSERLPRSHYGDDYYPFVANQTKSSQGWTNQDNVPVYGPQLWTGTLVDKQTVSLLVHIGEQDNKDLDVLKKIADGLVAIITAVGTLSGADDTGSGGSGSGGNTAWIKAGLTALSGTVSALKTNNHDDMIGTFTVVAHYENGALQLDWQPLLNTKQVGGKNTDAAVIFDATSPTSNGRYTIKASVATGAAAARTGTYLGVDRDRCSRDTIRVGNVVVPRDAIADADVTLDADGYFSWFCEGGGDSNDERTRPSDRSTNHVKIQRSSGTITWVEFHQ